MIKTCLKVCMLAGLLTTTGTFAQDKPAREKRDPEKMFAKIDTNSDGKISKDEAANAKGPWLKDNFATIDTNSDNYLDKEELKAYRKERMEKRREKKQK